jgi:1,4-dihydroxy-2-naphthoyl-CoA synthase
LGFTDILFDKSDGVARITINRPEVYNALRGKTTDEMAVALEDADGDGEVRVVVICGAGPNVEASFDRSGINGSFTSDLGPEQVLEGVQDACDMIRQRFDLYQESVLA